MFERDQLFIDGNWVTPESDASLTVISPHSEAVIGHAACAGTADANRAVGAAPAMKATLTERCPPAYRASGRAFGRGLPRQPGTGTATRHGFVDRDEDGGSADPNEERSPGDSTIGVVVAELAGHC